MSLPCVFSLRPERCHARDPIPYAYRMLHQKPKLADFTRLYRIMIKYAELPLS